MKVVETWFVAVWGLCWCNFVFCFITIALKPAAGILLNRRHWTSVSEHMRTTENLRVVCRDRGQVTAPPRLSLSGGVFHHSLKIHHRKTTWLFSRPPGHFGALCMNSAERETSVRLPARAGLMGFRLIFPRIVSWPKT